jgi:hypothetical protein
MLKTSAFARTPRRMRSFAQAQCVKSISEIYIAGLLLGNFRSAIAAEKQGGGQRWLRPALSGHRVRNLDAPLRSALAAAA